VSSELVVVLVLVLELLVVVLVLVVISYFLVNALRKESNLEDCLMSGRKNCVPLDVPAKR